MTSQPTSARTPTEVKITTEAHMWMKRNGHIERIDALMEGRTSGDKIAMLSLITDAYLEGVRRQRAADETRVQGQQSIAEILQQWGSEPK